MLLWTCVRMLTVLTVLTVLTMIYLIENTSSARARRRLFVY